MTDHIDVDPETGEVLTEGGPGSDERDGSVGSDARGPASPPSASTDLAVRGPVNLLGVSDPGEYLEATKAIADQLVSIIEDRHLYTMIGQSKHIEVAAWTYLGSMLGVFASTVGEPEYVKGDGAGGWKATAEARTLAGALVGRATALCMRSEGNWRSADDHDIMAMAQTRAIRNALKHPLGFIVQLAGYDVPDDKPRSPEQNARFHALIQEWNVAANITDGRDLIKAWGEARGYPASTKQWTMAMFTEAMDEIEARIQSAKVPF